MKNKDSTNTVTKIIQVAGRVVNYSFEGLTKRKTFRLDWEQPDCNICQIDSLETVVFVPVYQYGELSPLAQDGLRSPNSPIQFACSEGVQLIVADMKKQEFVFSQEMGKTKRCDIETGRRLHWVEIWYEDQVM